MVGEGLVFLYGSRVCDRGKEFWEGELGGNGEVLPKELDERRADRVVDSL
jgi:hypothetical protein